jgi:hypothetical protein
MHNRWLQLAERIGMDAFLELWRTLDEDETRAGTSILISMPRLSRFLRYQRNQSILDLYRDGLDLVEIQKHLCREFCEHISMRHIARVIDKRENKGR